MFAVMERHGLIEPGATEPVWTGTPSPGGMEESPEFSGIARRLIENPANMKLMEKILGEPACIIPIVQYRAYPPGGSITGVHQDGFFSPGIRNYKPERSEEHTSELQSLKRLSYAVFCVQKKNI